MVFLSPESLSLCAALHFAGAADALREEVVRSAWYEAFRADMRSNVIVRAVESSLGGVGSATTWTTTRLATASQRVMLAVSPWSP